jgi:hypothetical protein
MDKIKNKNSPQKDIPTSDDILGDLCRDMNGEQQEFI